MVFWAGARTLAAPVTLTSGCLLQVKYQMLAAASLLAEVVKVLERVTKQSADAASAELEGQQVGRQGLAGHAYV